MVRTTSLSKWSVYVVACALGAIGCGSSKDVELGPPTKGEETGREPPEEGDDAGAGGSGTTNAACTPLDEIVEVSNDKGTTPSILWSQGSYLLTWQARTAGKDEVHVATLAKDGSMSATHVVATLDGSQALPSLHETSAGRWIIWEDERPAGRAILARALDKQGAPAGATIEIATSDAVEARPTAAPLPSGLAVAWMSAQGTEIGLFSGAPISTTTKLPGAHFPALASRGDELAIAWSSGSDLSIARTSSMPAGALPGANLRSGSGDARIPRVAIDESGRAVAVWEDTRASDERIYLAREGAIGVPPSELRVDDDAGSANWPDVAVMGERTAVVYYQFRSGPPAIYLSIHDAILARIGDAIRISEKNARFPTIAWTGEELAIAWSQKDSGIRLRRVDCSTK